MAAYLTKPIKQSDLLDTIVTVRHRRLARRVNLGSPTLPCARASAACMSCWRKITRQSKARGPAAGERGHTVVVAGNGIEALAALERQAFDLVLMDVQMPEMDGFETTKAIREREAKKEHERHN